MQQKTLAEKRPSVPLKSKASYPRFSHSTHEKKRSQRIDWQHALKEWPMKANPHGWCVSMNRSLESFYIRL